MGQARRAHVEKQRAKEKLKQRIVRGTLAAGIFAAALAGFNQVADKEDSKSQAAVAMAEAKPMPQDLKDLLQKTSTPEAPVERLANMEQRELLNFKVGGRSIRVLQAGGEFEFGPINENQLASIKENYEVFSEYAQGGAKINMPVFEVDETDRIITQRSLEMQVQPLAKDVVLFLVPARVNIGEFSTSKITAPITFTDSFGPVSVSFARPDYANGFEGVMVEACQATIDAKIANPNKFSDQNTDKLSKITLLGQENICNSIAKAMYMSKNGFTFDEYAQIHSRQLLGGTNQPTANNHAFYGTEPHVGDVSVYASLVSGIPANIGDSLIYPPVN